MPGPGLEKFEERADRAEREIAELSRIFASLEQTKPSGAESIKALQDENRALKERIAALEQNGAVPLSKFCSF